MTEPLSFSNSFSSFLDIRVNPKGMLEVFSYGKSFQLRLINKNGMNRKIEENKLKELNHFLIDIFKKISINLNQVKVKNLTIRLTAANEAKVIVLTKNKANDIYHKQIFFVQASPLKSILSVSKNSTHPYIDHVNSPSLLKKLVTSFKAFFSLFIRKKSDIKELTHDFKEFIDKFPDPIKKVLLHHLTKLTEEEIYIANYLKENIDWTDLNQTEIILKILCGAYVLIEDEGKTYKKWSKELAKKYERPSSHEAIVKQYAFRGPIAREGLFSKKEILSADRKKQEVSWFQLERYPVNLTHTIRHLWTWLLYKWTGKNQGPFGASSHTEKSMPLILHLRSSIETKSIDQTSA